jgi:hypothetical protein
VEPPAWERRGAVPASTRRGRPLVLFAGLAGGLVAGSAAPLLLVFGMIAVGGAYVPPTPTEQVVGVAMTTLSGVSLGAAAASVAAAIGTVSPGRLFTRVAAVGAPLGFLLGVAVFVAF